MANVRDYLTSMLDRPCGTARRVSDIFFSIMEASTCHYAKAAASWGSRPGPNPNPNPKARFAQLLL